MKALDAIVAGLTEARIQQASESVSGPSYWYLVGAVHGAEYVARDDSDFDAGCDAARIVDEEQGSGYACRDAYRDGWGAGVDLARGFERAEE